MDLHLKFTVIAILIGAVSSVDPEPVHPILPTLTAPSGIFQPSANANTRFSRLLHQNAASLQFSSISNLAPPLPGLSKDLKDVKGKSQKKKLSLSTTHLGRRTLDYDDSDSFDDNGQPLARIITEPQPGNEYVYIRQGGIQTEDEQAAAASVASINRQPSNQRVPLTLLRQSDGKRVNISPVFANQAKNLDWENPIFQKNDETVPTDQEYEMASEHPTVSSDLDYNEATTLPTSQIENEDDQDDRKMIVNVVTSKPRVEFENQNKTSISSAITTSASKPLILEIKSGDTEDLSATDLKENLVVQSTRRIGNFPDFEDTPTRLQTAESSQPARVNVRPAQSGKEYEYEYIYYYYDDEDEDNSTAKDNSTKVPVSTKVGVSPSTIPVSAKIEPDFEDEDLEEFEEDAAVPEVVKPSASTPPAKSSEIVKQRTTTVTEKFSNSNPINQLDRSRSPKQAFPSEKATLPEVDYKIESGDFEQYEEEDEQIQVKAKGQPQRPPSADDAEDEQPEIVLASKPEEKVTSVPTTLSTSSSQDTMSTLAKSHPDSVNHPVILKQSTILQSVPASQFQPQTDAPTRFTSPLTTPTTTTTTTEAAASEVAPSVRTPSSRFRGQQRIRGSSTSEATKVRQQLAATEPSDQPEEVVAKPNPSSHRTFTKDTSRRTPSRRPQVETSQTPPETPSQSSSSQDAPVRTNLVRTRFPARTTPVAPAPTTTSAPIVIQSSTSETPAPLVEELSEQQGKENYVRRPVQPKVIGGFLNSNEQNTDSSTSSEATTVSSIVDAAPSSEQTAPVISTTSTTTSTTTEAVPLDKFGKQRNRFGRTRRPLAVSGNGASTSAPATEATVTISSPAPTQNRNRFSGRRKPSTPSPEETKPAEDTANTSAAVSEVSRPRIPSRNRFATRNRVQSPTTEVTSGGVAEEVKKEVVVSDPTVATPSPAGARRKPIFQGRRRNPSIGVQNVTASTQQDETASASTSSTVPVVKTLEGQTVKDNRPAGIGPIQRRRPGVGPRIRGGRLGSSTTTTEAAAPVSNENKDSTQEQAGDIEQSPTSQSEQLEHVPPSLSTSLPSATSDSPPNRGNAGVVGRLRTRAKLVTTTTTAAPEPVLRERKPSRLNGILNRRKPGIPLTTTITPAKEESKVEAAEEATNNANEQEDSQHKGVVVQVSSSVTESEEQKEQQHHGEEETEQSSTTAASILNRLKSQRKPGSIFRKRTDPHGE